MRDERAELEAVEAVARGLAQEALESNWQVLRDQLSTELLSRVQQCPPGFFERLVLDLLVQMGYGGSFAEAAQAVGRTGDGGIDGIIKEDKLGLDAVYVQAKRWTTSVGRPELQAFAGSLEGHHARKGVFITTSTFTNGAQKYVSQIEKRIVLIDGKQLVDLMIEHGVGVDVARSYDVDGSMRTTLRKCDAPAGPGDEDGRHSRTEWLALLTASVACAQRSVLP